MKKKIIAIGIGMMLCAGLFTGCGKTEVKQDTVAASSSEEGKQEGTAEEKELTGTIDEIKDFMFVVTDANNTHIALPLKKSRKVWRMSAAEIRLL